MSRVTTAHDFLPLVKKQKHDFHFFFIQCIIKQLLENDQGLGKGYHLKLKAKGDLNPYRDLIILKSSLYF